MNGEKPTPRTWNLPDDPICEEMTVARLVHPDDIKPGEYLMIVTSAKMDLLATPMGPTIRRVDGDPSFGGAMRVMAYDFPFIVVKLVTGQFPGHRLAIDVRRHKLVKVTKNFVRALKGPDPVAPPEPKPDPAELGLFAQLREAEARMLAGGPREVPRELRWKDKAKKWAWNGREWVQVPPDMGPGPEEVLPIYPDELPPPERNEDDPAGPGPPQEPNGPGPDDDPEGQGQGAVI